MTTTLLSMAGALALIASASCALTQTQTSLFSSQSHIDEAQVVTRTGNVHPLARPEFETGAVPADMKLDRMMLLLKPSGSQRRALDALLVAQQDPQSPLYHRWLTPAEYGARFGVSTNDLTRATRWLRLHGFTIDEVAASHRLVLFSGYAFQVADTFHTELRRYRMHAVDHVANVQDPQIPKALANVVSGVVSLHNFRREPAMRPAHASSAHPQWNMGSAHYLLPADFATIYNLTTLYDSGLTGTGTTIAIAGRSNINFADVSAFRAAANLAPAVFRVLLPETDPGLVNGDQDEATLDVEWSGAVAPAATVTLVAAPSTVTTDGIDLAAAYIVNHVSAQAVSVSYGSCEQAMGTTELALYDSLWEQAASEGISVFVASGDSGAAGCDLGSAVTGTMTGVNGLCSSPYATCVGGTEFQESSNPAKYWSITNAAGQASAMSYIPEAVWNESAATGGAGLWASGGGISTVYSQPVWQRSVSGAASTKGMRSVPDVALTAAAHDGYIIYENGSYWIVSGTSAGAPAFAGITAIMAQGNGGVGQGNINPALYKMLSAPENPFHRTLAGDNSVPGVVGFSANGADYNIATGLGSVDVEILLRNWSRAKVKVSPLPSRATPIPVWIRQRP